MLVFFQNNIMFLTISQSQNIKGILETMWEKITHRENPKFQNVEEAHRQTIATKVRQTNFGGVG